MIKPSSLRVTALAGIILFALVILLLAFFYLAFISGTGTQRKEDNFARAIREYDSYASLVPGIERDYIDLEQRLDRLEKITISTESWLSVLKRRRSLAREYPESKENYRTSINRALEIYPASAEITSLAAELLIKNSAITRETEDVLRTWIPSFAGIKYNNLLLSLHVLLGDFRNPSMAEILPYDLLSDGTESVTVNLILLKMLRGDIRGANSDIQSLFYSNASLDAMRFIAEFFYDYGEMERSAEIFTLINDEKSISRASDALYLAGFTESAKKMWIILSQNRMGSRDTQKILEKSLYNLGITSEDKEESIAFFESLLQVNAENISDYRQFGLIRLSRLLELPEAVAVLERTSGLDPSGFPFIDLEICRRMAVQWELNRQFAESWMLIDRHSENIDLFRWASWLFLFQRNFNELSILLDRIERIGFPSNKNNDFWPSVSRAIQLMNTGELEKAENILNSIPLEDGKWIVSANLGRIYEANRRHNLAIEQYRHAISRNPSPKAASKIQGRIAKCFIALQETRQAKMALEYAVELDPLNHSARLELDRLTY